MATSRRNEETRFVHPAQARAFQARG